MSLKRIAIVGSGIVGLSIALEALNHDMEVTVFEEAASVGRGASGHTAGVIHVIQLPFNSWKSRLAREGNPLYDKLSEILGFRIRRLPALLVYRNNFEKLAAIVAASYLRHKGISAEVIDKEETKRVCPDISKSIKGAIRVDGYATVIPLEVLNSFVSFLKEKGVEFHFNEKVTEIKMSKGDKVEVVSNKDTYLYDNVIVAAGGGTQDLIKEGPKLEYAKGFMVLTRGIECNAIVAALFSKTRNRKTKGGGIIPWPDYRVLFGPTFEETNDPWDTRISIDDAKKTLNLYKDLLEVNPKIDEYFAGTRIKAPPKYDFVLKKINNIIALYGIDSPGFTAAPALAKYIVSRLR
jgi:glycerol-3-phosphate dehydrogenase